MAFLKLNGVTINVGPGASNRTKVSGESGASFEGGHYKNVRHRKRSYTFKTTPYTEMEALAYAGLIRGDGHLFTMDDTTDSTKNLAKTSAVLGSLTSTVPSGFTGKSYVAANGTTNDYPVTMFKAQQDITFNVWTDTAAGGTTADEHLVNIFKTNTHANSFRIFRDAGDSDKLKFAISAEDAANGSNKTSSLDIADPFDGNFKMVTAVLRRNPESGETTQALYINGVSQGTATTAHIPDPSAFTRFSLAINPDEAAEHWEDELDEVQVLPYAAPVAMILGWYNFGQNSGEHPNLKMTGDVTHDSVVIVRGKVDSVEYIHAGGRVKQRLSFTLTEV